MIAKDDDDDAPSSHCWRLGEPRMLHTSTWVRVHNSHLKWCHFVSLDFQQYVTPEGLSRTLPARTGPRLKVLGHHTGTPDATHAEFDLPENEFIAKRTLLLKNVSF